MNQWEHEQEPLNMSSDWLLGRASDSVSITVKSYPDIFRNPIILYNQIDHFQKRLFVDSCKEFDALNRTNGEKQRIKDLQNQISNLQMQLKNAHTQLNSEQTYFEETKKNCQTTMESAKEFIKTVSNKKSLEEPNYDLTSVQNIMDWLVTMKSLVVDEESFDQR